MWRQVGFAKKARGFGRSGWHGAGLPPIGASIWGLERLEMLERLPVLFFFHLFLCRQCTFFYRDEVKRTRIRAGDPGIPSFERSPSWVKPWSNNFRRHSASLIFSIGQPAEGVGFISPWLYLMSFFCLEAFGWFQRVYFWFFTRLGQTIYHVFSLGLNASQPKFRHCVNPRLRGQKFKQIWSLAMVVWNVGLL